MYLTIKLGNADEGAALDEEKVSTISWEINLFVSHKQCIHCKFVQVDSYTVQEKFIYGKWFFFRQFMGSVINSRSCKIVDR